MKRSLLLTAFFCCTLWGVEVNGPRDSNLVVNGDFSQRPVDGKVPGWEDVKPEDVVTVFRGKVMALRLSKKTRAVTRQVVALPPGSTGARMAVNAMQGDEAGANYEVSFRALDAEKKVLRSDGQRGDVSVVADMLDHASGKPPQGYAKVIVLQGKLPPKAAFLSITLAAVGDEGSVDFNTAICQALKD